MNSSGIKRGLAATAISAMAVTGLPLLASSASANSMAEQAGGADVVTIYNPADLGTASIKNDGVNTTIHLVANGGANVIQVRFEYFAAGTWHTIATVGRSGGVFATEWAPPPALYNTSVPIRATGVSNIGTDIAGADTNTAVVSAAAEAIDIANAEGSSLGVFEQPYAGPNDKTLGGVSGTTSDLAADPTITTQSPSGTGAALPEDYHETVAAGDTSRDWSGPVDFSGYTWDSTPADGTVNQALVIASDQSDDAEAVSLYKQTITEVTAVATNPTVPAGGNSPVKVTVTDQNGTPVVGAQVEQDTNRDGTGENEAYTNSKGVATFTQSGATSPNTDDYFVNTTGTATYENGTDFKRSVTVSEYTPQAASITPTSKDGAAFDDDENALGDIFVTVKDQNGAARSGEVVRYAWTVTPFATTAGYPKTLTEGSATTDADGKATIPFPVSEPSGTYTLHTYINQDGTPGQQAGDLGGQDLTVKAGQADAKWDDGAVAQAPASSTATFEGNLVLEDGTALPGRNVAFTWTKNVTGNAVVAAQGAQPAGTTRTGDTTATAKTGTDGSFAVALTDPPANPTVNELNGNLNVQTTNTPDIGNAGDNSDLQVDFLKSAAPDSADDITVSAQDLIDAMATPGRPVDLDITVQNGDHTVNLTDYPVTVTVNHGFLSPNAETAADLKADPAAAEGGAFGEWASDGASKEFSTNDSGNTGTVVAIEKDDLFDTQQTVTTRVTITAGTVSKTVDIDFDSVNPLNGGAVSVERAAASQQTVSVLPKAPTNESVFYNVFTEDQFGNLVDGESVDLSDDMTNAFMNGTDGATTVNSQLADESPALELEATRAGDQTVTGKWTTEKNTWTDGDLVTAGFQRLRKTEATGTVKQDAGETVNWYVIDFANSTYTMTHDTADTVPVGTTVLMTYTAIDQMGEPINGVEVGFFRTGPDDYQDGDFNSFGTTGQDGKVSYVFAGAKAGTATVEGLITDYSSVGGDQIVPESRASDQVTFAGPVGPVPAGLTLRGGDNGAADDSLFANAIGKTEGATVKLFRKRADGSWKFLQKGVMNRKGNYRFEDVADLNGNKVTRYKAVVQATDLTKRGVGKKKVR